MKNLLALLAVGLVAAAAFLIVGGGSGYRVDSDAAFEDFLGMPSVMFFAGTYCSYCQSAVPGYEEQVWDEYKGDANVWLQVVDGASGSSFDTGMAQGYNAGLSYEGLAGEECNYVPSWVLMDSEGAPVLTSCGSEHSVEELVEGLGGLL